jgi:polyhydroxyalkanoate synthesis regulator phasin
LVGRLEPVRIRAEEGINVSEEQDTAIQPDADTGAASANNPGTVRDITEKALLLAVGAAALTKDRVQAVVEDFVKRGKLSTEDGRELVDSLGVRGRDQAKAAFRRLDVSLQGTYRDLGLATRRELEDIDFRLRQMEHRLSLLERQSDSAAGAPQDL